MIKQPNAWSCLPTAASILTGIPFDDIVKRIGHDGSRVVAPEKPDPWCREAFEPCELTKALLYHGWTTTHFHALLERSRYPTIEEWVFLLDGYGWPVIITVEKPMGMHAIAWRPQSGELIDPLHGLPITFPVEFPIYDFLALINLTGHRRTWI